MSAFTLLFLSALLSFGVHKLSLLKFIAIGSLIVGAVLNIFHFVTPLSGFSSSSGIEFFEIILFIVLIAVILSQSEAINITQTLFIASASVLLLESATLLSFIISFEALSILSFILVSQINNATHAAGAVKIFISGALATGMILLGTTLYTFSGDSINALINTQAGIFAQIGIWIILAGVFYKLTIVPMHTWAADTYAQVKPSHAALLSGVVKSAVAVAAFKFFAPFLLLHVSLSIPALATLAVITMTLGNVLALFQRNIAKILSYSSIAHAGYILLAFVAVQSAYAQTSILYLATAYIFMQSALFLLLDKISNGANDLTLEDLKGLAKTEKLTALFFTVQLFSLAGIPLLGGFLAKAVVVYALVDANLIAIALITLLNSALSVAYYAWIVKHIYFDEANEQNKLHQVNKATLIAQAILVAGTLYFGIFASTIFSLKLF